MKNNTPIFLTGHNGFVGSSMLRILKTAGFKNILVADKIDLDLKDQIKVINFFENNDIEIVLLCASKMGGVNATLNYPGEFIYDNLMIYSNIIECSRIYGIKRLIFFSSSAIYPADSPQPMKEEYILDGKLHPSNKSYAISKIAGQVLCESYNYQYGTNFVTVISTNLFGPNDNYNPKTSNVIPALIKKFSDAKIKNKKYVEIWGSGSSVRDFLFVDDLSEAVLDLIKLPPKKFNSIDSPVNIGSGIGYKIIEIAEIIKDVVGYNGQIITDLTKPDGASKKILDIKKINNLGWSPKYQLKKSLEITYKAYLDD